MKKFKLSVKKGAPVKNIWLFSDPESLLIWLLDFNANKQELIGLKEETTRIPVRPEDKMEIEWMGCEYVYEHGDPIRIDLVRIVKASPPMDGKSGKKGLFVSGYSGWVVTDLLQLRHNAKFDDITVKRINEDESQILMPVNDHMVHSQVAESVSKIMKSLNLPKV